MEKKSKKKMSWCSDAPEDEAISLFAGLLANPDVRLSQKAKELNDFQRNLLDIEILSNLRFGSLEIRDTSVASASPLIR